MSTKQITAEEILDVFNGAEFERFYNNQLMDYIEGEIDAPSKGAILEKISDLFNVPIGDN